MEEKRNKWRPFAEARNFARSLKLSGKGWRDIGDWLGKEKIANQREKPRSVEKRSERRSFAEARNFVRSLRLKSYKEWEQYRKGALKGYERRPKDIPSNPNIIYKDLGWQGINDWLGTEITAGSGGKRNFRSFGEARSFVHTLKLKNSKEWWQYSKGALKGYERRPLDIPSVPHRTYKDQGWQGMGDWLGNGRIGRGFNFRSFAEARSFVHTLKLKNSKEWKLYAKGVLKGYERRPLDIPSSPHRTYKDQGWQSMGDWLGNGRIRRGFNSRSFTEARSFVHTLKLKDTSEWQQYAKGTLKGYERKPLDIPSVPHRAYKDQGWQGMRDWLGK